MSENWITGLVKWSSGLAEGRRGSKDIYGVALVNPPSQYPPLQKRSVTIWPKINCKCFFTKCVTMVTSHPRRQEVHAYPHLDDWFFRAASAQENKAASHTTMQILHSLGFSINLAESSLSPSQTIVHWSVNRYLWVSSSNRSQNAVSEQAYTILSGRVQDDSERSDEVTGFYGIMHCLVPYARLRMRPIQKCLAIEMESDNWPMGRCSDGDQRCGNLFRRPPP